MSKMTRRVVLMIFAIALVTVTTGSSVSAQTGSIAGTVASSTGQPVGNAAIQLRNAQGQIVGTGSTNAAGEYIFTGVPPGTYTVEVLNDKGEPVAISAQTLVESAAVTGVNITEASLTAAAAGGGSDALAIFLALAGLAAVIGVGLVGNNASPTN